MSAYDSLGRFYPDHIADPQRPADVAVIVPTVGRPELARALASIYVQRCVRRLQLLIGVDGPRGPAVLDFIHGALGQRPAHVSATVLALPYSTAVRNGGVFNPGDGGSLRAMLSLMVNAPRLTWLDDDNEWRADHLARLNAAIDGKVYAFAHRMLVDEDSGRELGVDRWHSVGPGRGERASVGGLVDTNCLMVDAARAAEHLGAWAQTWGRAPGAAADQRFFTAIAEQPHGEVREATVLYRIPLGHVLRHRLAGVTGAVPRKLRDGGVYDSRPSLPNRTG